MQKRDAHKRLFPVKRFLLAISIALFLVLASVGFFYGVHFPTDIDVTESTMTYFFTFDEPVLTLVTIDNMDYTQITIHNCLSLSEPGEPQVPIYLADLLVPQGRRIKDITVSKSEPRVLDHDFLTQPILPQENYVPFSSTEKVTIEKNLKTYAANKPVIKETYKDKNTSFCRGYEIHTVKLFPIQYTPKTGIVEYYPEMSVTITYATNLQALQQKKNAFLRGTSDDVEFISSLVENPEVIDTYEPLGGGDGDPEGGGGGGAAPLGGGTSICDPVDTYDYVIITNEALNNTVGQTYNWSDLLSHRSTYTGLSGTKVTVERIAGCSDYWNDTALFNDSAAQVREFIKDAYTNWDTRYVLLGGDWDTGDANRQIVPMRMFYVWGAQGYTYPDMPCDLYFSNLDGDWRDTTHDVWGGGEGSGVNDHFSEVFVGRLTVDSAEQISNIIGKILWYDLEADDEFLTKTAFFGGNLGWSITSADYMEELRNGTDPHFYSCTGFTEWNAAHPQYELNVSVRKYYDWGDSIPTSYVSVINNNDASIINHLSHGSPSFALDMTNGYLKTLTNTKYYLAVSEQCLAGRFIAGNSTEKTLLCYDSSNGAYALIWNTGYGWGSQTSTNGAGQFLQRHFWDYFFDNDSSMNNWALGNALGYTKDTMSSYVDQGWHYSWCYNWYSTHLFGDPAQQLRIPCSNASVQFSDESPADGATNVSRSTSSLTITMQDPEGDPMTWTIETSPDVGSASGNDGNNGTKTCDLSSLNYDTTYTWYVNATDGTSWTNESYSFTTEAAPINNPPSFTNMSPANGTRGVSLSTTLLSLDLSDAEGHALNWTIETSPVVGSASGSDDSNGTKTCSISGLSEATRYVWYVNATDGSNWTRAWYTFTTNSFPILSDISPANGSENCSVSTAHVSVYIADAEGDTVNWTIETSPAVGNDEGTVESNGTKLCILSGLSYGTPYRWYVNVSDGKNWTNASYIFTTQENQNPVNTNPTPSSGSTGVEQNPRLYIDVSDPDDAFQTLNITFRTNATGLWTTIGSNTSVNNGTYSQQASSMDSFGTTYYWSVNTSDGHGGWDNDTYSFTIREENQPLPPSAFEAVEQGRFDIALSWNKGSSADSTYLEYHTVSSSWSRGQGTIFYNGTGSSTIHTNLAPATIYHYQAWSWNETDHCWSSTSSVTNATTASNHLPSYSGITPENGSSEQPLSLTWSCIITDDDGDVFNWSIACSNGQDTSGSLENNGSQHLILSDLEYSTSYTIWLNVTDNYGWTREWFTFATRALVTPTAPQSFSASASSKTQIGLTWSHGTGSDKALIVYKTASYPTNRLDGTLLCNTSASSTSATGLSVATTYYFSAWSWNATDHTWSSSSSQDSATTSSNTVLLLSNENPENGSTGVSISLDSLSLTLQDPDGDSFDWSLVTTPDIGSTSELGGANGSKSCSVSRLSYGTTYTWTVRASDGYSWSNASYTFTTEEEPVEEPQPPSGGGGGGSSGGGGSYPPPSSPPEENVTELNTPPSTPSPPAGPSLIEMGVDYSFEAESIDLDGDSIRYRFDWGDGNLSAWSDYVDSNTTITMIYQWHWIDTFAIRVLAQDSNGTNSSWSDPLEITVSQIEPTQEEPLLTIEYAEESDHEQSVEFSAVGELDPGIVIISYTWDFGDGHIGSGPTPSHFYEQPGEYEVTLTILDSNGIKYSQNRIITITAQASNTPLQTTETPFSLPLLHVGIILLLGVCSLLVFFKRKDITEKIQYILTKNKDTQVLTNNYQEQQKIQHLEEKQDEECAKRISTIEAYIDSMKTKDTQYETLRKEIDQLLQSK